jgi:hypothetical protein
MTDSVAKAIHANFTSPNECDANFENANIVDALFFIGRAIRLLGITYHVTNCFECKKSRKHMREDNSLNLSSFPKESEK